MTPYKCPVCEGKVEDYKKCGPCEGTGIIWDKSFKLQDMDPQPTIPYIPWIPTFPPYQNPDPYYTTIGPNYTNKIVYNTPNTVTFGIIN